MDPSSFTQETLTQKPSLASSINNNSFISKICGFSRGISCSKNPIQETSKKPQLVLDPTGFEELCGKNQMGIHKDDLDDAYEDCNWLVYSNQDVSDDEHMNPRFNEQRLMNLIDKIQLVNLKKKKVIEKDLLVNCSFCNMGANSSSLKVVSMDDDDRALGLQRAKMSFHLPSIPKPQDVYRIVVNNVNQPFEHVWLQMSDDRSRFIHPLEKLSVFDFVDEYVNNMKPAKPLPVESTPFKLVEDVKELEYLVSKLNRVDEFAVDLEHNQYRSYQGITCLMQISTRTEDFIIDTFKLRIQIGPYLREIFRDPTKRKVMHGADKDVLWLQRDFGIYVCNMFDTGQASRVLKMERNSLEYVLRYFCGLSLYKECQTADWRLRPLTDEMLRYAREDTHYLLYIYDLMKTKLLSSSPYPNRPEALLVEVYQRSYNVCVQMYQKDIVTEDSYLNIYGLHSADLNSQQLAIVAGLYEWRDIAARAADESTGYVLPNKSLIEIAKQMPVTIEELHHLLKFRHPFIERNLGSVISIIESSMENATMFEDVANRLKAQRLETEAARVAYQKSGTASAMSNGAEGAHYYSNISANQFGNYIETVLAGVHQNHRPEGSSEQAGGNGNTMNRSGQRVIRMQDLGTSVQVLSNLTFGHEGLIERVSGKQKFDLDQQFGLPVIEETKLKKIIPLPFNLPFPYPMVKPEPPVPAMKQFAKAQETSNHEEPTTPFPKPKHGIVLQDSSFFTIEKKRGCAVHSRSGDKDENVVISLDPDPRSNNARRTLSSFQKCLQTKTGNKSGGHHKDGPGEGDGGFKLGMWSQAFPMNGNTSVTF